MQIAIISDTHLPKGNRRLPTTCIDRLRAADLTIHAGDLIRLAVLRELQSYGEVIAVYGNVDDSEVREALPETAAAGAGGAIIAIVHDAGPVAGRIARMRRRFPAADAVVFGHSHTPLHQIAEDGFQIFNPGSPTERRSAPRHTMGWVEAHDGRLSFELIDLD